MKYKKYPSYKHCGVEWLGEIPSDWNITKVKHKFLLGRGRVISLEGLDEDGEYPVYSSQTKNNGILGYINSYDFDCKQITWTTDGANAGTVFLREGKHNCTNVCGTLLPIKKNENLEYLTYTLGYATTFYKRPDTNGAKIMNGEMSEIFLTFPPVEEQQQIANFLDKATAKIDTLIEKQTKQIELLKEKRQAVISHAVTKGINPNVPMKDSGVEWLGVIPEHWEVKKLGLITSKIGSGKTPRGGSEVYSDSGILFLRSQNIYDDGLFLDEVVYISEEINNEMLNTQIKDGDILLNVTGGSIGRTCLIPSNFQKANVNQHVCIIRLNTKEDRLFISYLMKSALIKSQIDGIQNGAAREGLNFEQISGFKIVLPPKNEQNEIVNYVNDKTSKIDTLIEKSKKSIELLKEKRTALISACVTGKIDVRELV